uniref:Cell division protein ZapB n=1 Tax=Candidatus Kentrum sp. LFY TaxID=2126342 RepID=A0A450V8N9_9GAMM|nr:MAG: cell division protein ZapB [Candidatus Kentron sp. LFY]VFK01175.1 MAG: cell division protein ZapB [Candidatus Kentron sp. LFY]
MQELERRIDVLIRAYDGLKRENRTLREQKIDLIAERVALIEKLELAKVRIENMVAQLKLMETGSWDGKP